MNKRQYGAPLTLTIIHKNRDSLLNSERESFNSAADHRLAELITGKLYDRIPKEIWKYVR
nr:Hha/YmoA family nucleoid-associated regulatory protein [Escherichia coli]